MSKERLYLYDTTLRDGAQTTGVDFSLADKRRIMRVLDDLGLDYIEGGYPGANTTDTELFSVKPDLKIGALHRFRHDQAGRALCVERSGIAGVAAIEGRQHLPGREVVGLSRPRGARHHER